MIKFSAKSPNITKAATLFATLLLGLSGTRAVFLLSQANNEPPKDEISLSQNLAMPNNRKVDYKRLAQLHLLGKVEKKSKHVASKQKKIKAPETSLNLKLIGVLFNRKNNDGYAIISESGKQQKTFHKGDKVFKNATLHSVEPNRVILIRNGRHETLTLIKHDLGTLGASSINTKITGVAGKSLKNSHKKENVLDAVRKSLNNSPAKENQPGNNEPTAAFPRAGRII